MKHETSVRHSIAQSFARWWWPALVASCWILTGAIYLTLPPSPDQFELDYMGWQMLEGAVPYRDFIDMNWPGVLWLHALSTFLFGNHLWSWRALDFIVLALSAVLLQDLLTRAAGKTAAAISWLLYPLFYISLGQWFSGQPDMTAGQLLLGALWCHVRGYETPSWRWQLGTGLFLAAAMLNKPTVGVLGPLLMAQAVLAGMPARRVVVHTAVAAAAAVGGLILALIALLGQGATLGEVTDAIYTYNVWTQFVDAASFAGLAQTGISLHVFSWHYLSVLAVLGALWLVWSGRSRVAATALAVLWLAGVLSFLVQQRGFGYHLAACFISIVGLASVAIGACLDAGKERARPAWPAAIGGLLLLTVIAGGVKKLHGGYPLLPAALLQRNPALHLAQYKEGDGLTVADAVALTGRIERAVPAGEAVFVLGTASSMNFLSRRPHATRFFYAPTLINARAPLPMAQRWVALFESDLLRTRPRWCLISTWARRQWLEGDSRGARFLRDYLAAHYRRIGFIGAEDGLEIYERI